MLDHTLDPILTLLQHKCRFLCIRKLLFTQFIVNVQALDMLGSTKWRVNRKILSVVECIWAAGGNVAGLVPREDVST